VIRVSRWLTFFLTIKALLITFLPCARQIEKSVLKKKADITFSLQKAACFLKAPFYVLNRLSAVILKELSKPGRYSNDFLGLLPQLRLQAKEHAKRLKMVTGCFA
jgi:hypothetical protein